jgi:hypothetical protein
MPTPPLRLAFAAVYWRIFTIAFAWQQFTAFHKTRHRLRMAGPGEKFAAFLDFAPYAIVLGLLAAAIATLALDLLVRNLARPIVARWYAPRGTGSERTPLSFRLGADEEIVAECPARIRAAFGWRPGTLVRTSASLAFYPTGWEVEPWLIEAHALRDARIEPRGDAPGSLLLGVPGRLVIRAAGGGETAFAVADPEQVRTWCAPGGIGPAAPAPASHDLVV